MKFLVTVPLRGTVTYQVEALSEETAKHAVACGAGKMVSMPDPISDSKDEWTVEPDISNWEEWIIRE